MPEHLTPPRRFLFRSLFFYIYFIFLLGGSISAEKVCISKTCFDVEVSQTEEQRQKGLMFRKSLKENSGMLFVFATEGVYPFWMKNTLISLDIIWIDRNKTVTHIQRNTRPFSETPINPGKKAKWVLEVPAGSVVKNRINLGHPVKIEMR